MPTSSSPIWDGALNFADLGGLSLSGGGLTRHGRVFRSGAPEWLTTEGWRAARAAELRRVIDLRNEAERGRGRDHPTVDESAAVGIEVVHLPTEDPDDPVFLAQCGPWLDHPRSWAPNLALYPEKFASIFTALAEAPGPVLIHCAGGRDRTGMVCSMLLALAGAEAAAICVNYENGFRGAALHRGHGWGYDPATDQWTTAPDRRWTVAELDGAVADRLPALREWIAATDVRRHLGEAGLTSQRLDRLRGLLRR